MKLKNFLWNLLRRRSDPLEVQRKKNFPWVLLVLYHTAPDYQQVTPVTEGRSPELPYLPAGSG